MKTGRRGIRPTGSDTTIDMKAEPERAKNRLSPELADIVRIQRSLLPPIPDDTKAISFAVRYSPCAHAGGDFYSIRKTRENHYALVIADVSGHGAGAAVVVAMFRAWMGAFRLGWQPLETIASGINTLWSEVSSLSNFATAQFYEINEITGWIRSINCGHPPALVVSPDGKVRELLHDRSLPLGVVPELETTILEDTIMPGETLVLYTDGIIEARNSAREFFGSERLADALGALAGVADLQTLADSLMRRVVEFSTGAPQADDQCLLLARVAPKPNI
jgi:sigma-B regulation protein RsbU (phosphoserine phosphatase)